MPASDIPSPDPPCTRSDDGARTVPAESSLRVKIHDVAALSSTQAPAHPFTFRGSMTPRKLRWTAFAIALALQAGMVVAYGMATEWCFCAITQFPEPAIPPPFVIRFIRLATLPAHWLKRGLPLPVLFVLNLEVWFLALLALLHGLALAARVRFRADAGAPPRRGIRLANREAVRPIHVALLAVPLLGAAMAGGAMHRRAWLAEAEQVFTATVAAASAGRPLPPNVELRMWDWRGDDMVEVTPEARFATRVDARISGDRFLDRFVTPYEYGGVVRFESGRRYYFSVDRHDGRWSVGIDRSRPRERW
jgi:uncharacterized membrane protein